MVAVAPVHEDFLAHAIWTVPVVSHVVVADHRRHHSSELELVEARMLEIADAIDQAMYLPFSLSLYHKQVIELEGILAVDQANLAFQEVHPGGAGGPQSPGPRGTSGSSKKVSLAEKDTWSQDLLHLLSRLQPLSIKCGVEEVELGCRTNPHAS